MAKTNTCPHIQNVNNPDGRIQNTDGTNKITIWTAGANDSVLKSLGLTSTDSASKVVQIFVNIGGAGTDRIAGTVSVPALSGTDGVAAAVDVLRSTLFPYLSFDAYGNKVFNAKAGTLIKMAVVATVTSGKEIDAVGEGGDF